MRNFLKLFNLIHYSGICTAVFLVITFILGISGYNYKLHKLAAWVTIVFAAFHGGLVGFRVIKMRLAKRG